MKRQAIETSIRELRELADELEKEQKEIPGHIEDTQATIVAIINPKGLSDTWKFE